MYKVTQIRMNKTINIFEMICKEINFFFRVYDKDGAGFITTGKINPFN